MWISDCLDSVCSDMSVLHHIEDIRIIDGPTFFRLAYRLPAYEGASRTDLEGWLKELQGVTVEGQVDVDRAALYPNKNFDTKSDSLTQKDFSSPDRVLTLDELEKAGPPAPGIGEFAPIFEIVRH